MTSTGTQAASVPGSFHAATTAVAKIGPIAKPTLPPAANQRIPVAFFAPAT